MADNRILYADALTRVALLVALVPLNKKGALHSGFSSLIIWLFAWGLTVISSGQSLMTRGNYTKGYGPTERTTVSMLMLFSILAVMAYSIYLTVAKSNKDKEEGRLAEQKKMSTVMVALSWTVVVLAMISFKFFYKYKL